MKKTDDGAAYSGCSARSRYVVEGDDVGEATGRLRVTWGDRGPRHRTTRAVATSSSRARFRADGEGAMGKRGGIGRGGPRVTRGHVYSVGEATWR